MRLFFGICLLAAASLVGVDKEPLLVKKSRSPVNDNALVMLMHYQLVKKNEEIIVRTRSAAIGQLTSSNTGLSGVQRKDQFCDVLAVIDGKKSFALTYLDGMPFIESQRYFHYTLEKKLSTIPGGLSAGPHALVVMLRNSYGETVKVSACMDAMVFSYETPSSQKELEKVAAELEKPQIIYNEPTGTYQKEKPILVDFYKLNCILGGSEYKVAVYLDGKLLGKVSSWSPYILKNVLPGQHTLRLELLSPLGEVVPNPFGVTTEGSFTVK